jgi:hypothetical protein
MQHVKYVCHYKNQENLSIPVRLLFSLQAAKLHRNINTIIYETMHHVELFYSRFI